MAKKLGLAPKAEAMLEFPASTPAVAAACGAAVSRAVADAPVANGSAAAPITALALPFLVPSTSPVALDEADWINWPAATEVLALALNDPLDPMVSVLALA